MAQKIKGNSLDKPAFRTPLGKPSALVIPQTPKHQTATSHPAPILIDRPLIGVSGSCIGRPHLNSSQSICDSSPLWRVFLLLHTNPTVHFSTAYADNLWIVQTDKSIRFAIFLYDKPSVLRRLIFSIWIGGTGGHLDVCLVTWHVVVKP